MTEQMGVDHHLVTPYHPRGNGIAENHVKTACNMIQKMANGFSNYTNDNGQVLSTEEMLEQLRYMTEIVFPAIEVKSKQTQKKMVEHFNAVVLQSDFPEGAKVMTLDPIKGDKLSP